MKRAVILAGGEGKRLRPVTYEIPKPLVPVHRKPILSHMIDFLGRYGVSDVAVVASARHRDDFERWRACRKGDVKSPNLSIFYEEKPCGTFGYMRFMKEWLNNERFILANGDSLFDFNIDALEQFHLQQSPVVTVPLLHATDPAQAGVVRLQGAHVSEIGRERHPQGSAPAFVDPGFYICEPVIMEYDDPSRDFVTTEVDILPLVVRDGKCAGLRMEPSRFYDCGTFERWERAITEW